MRITHKIDKFLQEIFPNFKKSNNDLDVLKDELSKYYSIGPYKPMVTIKDDLITIEIDIPSINDQQPDYQKCIALCEKRKYEEAKPILKNLIAKNPAISEYHRIMG